MLEKRRAKRWRLFYYLRLFDTSSGELLGHVVDITTQGMMVISEHSIPKGIVYNLRMELPDTEGVPADLELRAQSRWSTCDGNKSFYDTGFTLVNPSREIVESIQQIVDELHRTGPITVADEDRYLKARTG